MTYLIQSGKGETFNFVLAYTDASGNPIDLTGHTVKFNLLTPNSPGVDPVISVTATTSSDGTISVHIPATDTAALDAGEYVYVIIDTDSAEVDWLLRDRFDLLEVSSIVV